MEPAFLDGFQTRVRGLLGAIVVGDVNIVLDKYTLNCTCEKLAIHCAIKAKKS